ncbi:MAG: hypothetical protein MJB14_21360, partial [Spirochaetes bacterium]|nr:hypothetical protein [Spirochaetota bacterium]
MKKLLCNIIILCCLFSCKNHKKTSLLIKDQMLKKTEMTPRNWIDHYQIKNPQQLIFEDPNYYYLFAKYYYQRSGFDAYYLYCIQQGISTENIYQKESIVHFLKTIINENKYQLLNDQLMIQFSLLPEDWQAFWTHFNNKDFRKAFNYLPNDIHYIPLISYILHQTDMEIDIELKKTFTQYLSKVYQKAGWLTYYHELKEIEEWVDSSYIAFLNQLANEEFEIEAAQWEILFQEVIEDGLLRTFYKQVNSHSPLRKQLFQLLKKYQQGNSEVAYLYSLEVLHFKGIHSGIRQIKKVIDQFSPGSSEYYYLQSKVLINQAALTKQWLDQVVEFINHYPEYYRSRLLLGELFIMAIQQKNQQVLKWLNKIKVQSLSSTEQANFYYRMFVLTQEKYWMEQLKMHYPLSYGALRLTSQNIENTSAAHNLPEVVHSEKGKDLELKFKYYQEFQDEEAILALDWKSVDHTDDQIIIQRK